MSSRHLSKTLKFLHEFKLFPRTKHLELDGKTLTISKLVASTNDTDKKAFAEISQESKKDMNLNFKYLVNKVSPLNVISLACSKLRLINLSTCFRLTVAVSFMA